MTDGELKILEGIVRRQAEIASLAAEAVKRARSNAVAIGRLDARIRDLERRLATVETIRD